MPRGHGLTYAPVLAGAFVLYPFVAFLGGQGYSPLLVLAALPVLFFSRPSSFPPMLAAALALLVWAGASAFWRDGGAPAFSGSLLDGTFSVNAAGLRLLLTGLAGIGVIMGAVDIYRGEANRSVRVMVAAFLALALILIIIAPFQDFFFALFDPISDATREAPMNLKRCANGFALVLPILVAMISAPFRGVSAVLVGLAVYGIGLAIFAAIDTHAAIVAVIFAVLASGVTSVFKRSGFKLLFGALAAYIMLAPPVIGGGLAALEENGATLPSSFQSRAWSWQFVTEKIAEKPLIGHGMEASKDWTDTVGTRPDWLDQIAEAGGDRGAWSNYKIVPGHPHNMALQLWAEAGLIGALLASLLLVLIGWRMPPPDLMSNAVRRASAGVAGASTSMFSVAYSLWNEAYWASVILAAVAVILLSRQERS